MTRPSLAFALALVLTAAGARGAAAQATQITSAAGLLAGNAVFANPDPAGTVRVGPAAYAAPGLTLTFTAARDTLEVGRAGVTYFGSAFPDGTPVTWAAGPGGAQGPLTLDFSAPVSEFGFGAEEFSAGPTTFTFGVFNQAMLLGTFTAFSVGSFDPAVPGVLAFLGARAPAITRVVISNDSENNIGVGPASYRLAPAATVIPEPSVTALAGAGLAALGLLARRRRAPVA